ncbi:MAG: gliding motility-associated C-terminal domain-containing protein [Spirosomataceae bacterium]
MLKVAKYTILHYCLFFSRNGTFIFWMATVLCSFTAQASHIVGGEIELKAVTNQQGATHELTLNLYFDAIYGRPQAEDQQITLYFFRKRDNSLMGTALLPQVSDDYITYNKPSCAIGDLATRLIKYTTLVNLEPDKFDDEQGYYIVWEKCCRNAAITNLQNPGGTGATFYLQFPALKQNGKAIAYSSPHFQPIISDYICINQAFTFEFGATDPDGDKLVYSMAPPFRGTASTGNPTPISTGNTAFSTVVWNTGYSPTNAIPGPIPLRIDKETGRLQVTAGQLGLFAFAVLIEEYRDGKKIGETHREFQLKVVDCPKNDPPLALLREKGKSTFYNEKDILRVAADQSKCFNILITDRNVGQKVSIVVRNVNFTDAGVTITPNQFTPTSTTDTLRTQICFGNCTESENGKALVFEVIASDDGCPFPQRDTLRVYMVVDPQSNNKPTVSTDLPNNQATVVVGTPITFKVNGNDIDNDKIVLEGKGRGFSLPLAGMNFPTIQGMGKLTQTFSWTPTCSQVTGKEYVIDFVITDTRCSTGKKDSVSVKLLAVPRTSKPPEVVTTLPGNSLELTVTASTGPITFDVIATDPDNDPITLTGVGRGFVLSSVEMVFENKVGTGRITSPFSWTPDCKALNGKDDATYVIDFITEDNSCQPNRFDTVTVTLSLKNLLVSYEIKTPNVFTPNGDGKNDYFTILNLPPDNCTEQFLGVEIYNRWGGLAYESKDRNFKWYGESFAAGEYFYSVRYTKRNYKGTVSLLK